MKKLKSTQPHNLPTQSHMQEQQQSNKNVTIQLFTVMEWKELTRTGKKKKSKPYCSLCVCVFLSVHLSVLFLSKTIKQIEHIKHYIAIIWRHKRVIWNIEFWNSKLLPSFSVDGINKLSYTFEIWYDIVTHISLCWCCCLFLNIIILMGEIWESFFTK